jgi:hypothetical protein
MRVPFTHGLPIITADFTSIRAGNVILQLYHAQFVVMSGALLGAGRCADSFTRMDRLSRRLPEEGRAGHKKRWPAPRWWLTYAVRMVSDLSPEIAACAAARRAIGTR